MDLNLIEHLIAQKIKIEDLLLNPNNPRLMDKTRRTELVDNRICEDQIQESVNKEIRAEGVNDLYAKITKLGFLNIDRIVVRKLENTEKYVVLEGNRRITTAKLILNENGKGIITLDEKIINSIKEIEVLVYTGDDKNIIWVLQGMRHINGIKEWGPLQQSRFLYEMQLDKSLNPTELDKMTGLGRTSIANKIRSYKGFLIAKEIYHGEINENKYSLFQEAIFTRPLIKAWLQWDDAENKFLNTENLENLLNWFVGDEEGNIRFTRVLDIRDSFNQLLLPDHKDVLQNFIDKNDYSLNEALQDIRKKDAEKNAQKNQLDLNERLKIFEEFYTSVSTLPTMKIIKDQEMKLKFYEILINIKETTEFQLTHFAK